MDKPLIKGKVKHSKASRCTDNPDRSRAYLVLRATADGTAYRFIPILDFPRGGPAVRPFRTNTLFKHWLGGWIEIINGFMRPYAIILVVMSKWKTKVGSRQICLCPNQIVKGGP